MNLLFESPSWILSSLLIVIPSILICLFFLWLVRKSVSIESLKKHHDVAGFTFSIIGVLYSVILAFTVINVQTRYNGAEETIHTEAVMLSDLYRDASFFGDHDRDQIRSVLREYVKYVLDKEWHSPLDPKVRLETQTILAKLWSVYHKIQIDDEKAKIWYEQSIAKMDNLMNARLSREFDSWEHLGGMMWTLLIVGALITIGFMFFFGLENMRMQMLMTSLLAGYVSFILYLIFSLDHIFNGPEAIKPIAIEQIFLRFDQWDKSI